MAKRKKRKRPGKFGTPRVQQRMVSRDQINITREAARILRLAQDYEARIVVLGPLIFFSTRTGDAWMLDPEDGLALCLARDGDELPFTITETGARFSIEWDAHYRIDENAFVVIERSGRVRTISGYPTKKLQRLCQ
jgi:hypothetical protein